MLICVLLLAGCAELKQYSSASGDIPEPKAVNYLLSCLNEIQGIGPEEFTTTFEKAEADLQRGRNLDKLRFICVSLHADADYQQLKKGTSVLEQYITEQTNSPDDIKGFQILVDRLDVAIMTKWSAWKSLSEDKKALSAEVESLQEKLEQDEVLIEELQKQIEQLKNIENIIESRETDQP